MKRPVMGLVAAALMFMFTPNLALAWNCSDPLAARIPVASGTQGTFGDGDGQLFLGKAGEGTPGVLYECEQPPPPSTPSSMSNSTSNATANSQSNSNSSSSSKQNQKQTQSQNQTQVALGGQGGAGGSATGGSATATGGSITNSGNSSSKSSVSNSGNSSNKNTNTATGGNQSQSSTSSANGNGDGNGNNSNDSVTNIKDPRQVATAIAGTVLPTVPCFKGIGAGVQTGMFGASFGGGKIDANCAALEASRLAPTLIARCKVYITNKYVKAAGVTMEDCLGPAVIVETPRVAVIAAPEPPVITVNVPAPQITIIPTPVMPPPPSVVVAAARVHHKAHVVCDPTVIAPSGKRGCVVTNETVNK